MTIEFAPFFSWPILAALGALALVLAVTALLRGVRGATLRTLALAALLMALANPTLNQEDREQLSTIVPIVVDRSQSQETAGREQQTDQALAELRDRFSRYPRIETRIVEAGDDVDSDTPSTKLFTALRSAMSDVPPARVGGAVFLTDGQIHDLPGINQDLGFNAPVHGLITGQPNEFDRRIEVLRAPRFGIVGGGNLA